MDEKTWRPRYPERICWGCDKLCPANDLACGGGTIRTQHPVELFGDGWRPPDEPEETESPRTSSQEITEPIRGRWGV